MPDSPAEKSLRRVLLIAAIDGWSLSVFAGLCTFIALLFGEWLGVSIGATIAFAGIWELRGRSRLAAGDIAGLSWLVRAQVLVLATIGLYAFRNLLAYDEAAMMAAITPEMRDLLSQAGIALSDLQALLKPVYFALYLTVIGVTLLFQGGLALYYFTRREKVASAFSTHVAVPPSLPSV